MHEPVTGHLPPRISVIVPVFNDCQGLRTCLGAFASQHPPPGLFEVIVVDNGSDEPHDRIVAEFPFARYLHEREPGSYRARNAGCRTARGRILAFTDADCEPASGWIQAIEHFFADHPESGFIGGPVVMKLPVDPSVPELYQKLFGFPQDDFVGRLGFCATANMAVRKDAFERVGPFDGSLYSGGDMEWGQRASCAGLRPVYVPEMVVFHRSRTTLRELARKHRRVAGGHMAVRRTRSGWLRALGFAFFPALPARRALRALPAFRGHGMSAAQALKVVGVIVILAFVSHVERLRVLFGGDPVRA